MSNQIVDESTVTEAATMSLSPPFLKTQAPRMRILPHITTETEAARMSSSPPRETRAARMSLSPPRETRAARMSLAPPKEMVHKPTETQAVRKRLSRSKKGDRKFFKSILINFWSPRKIVRKPTGSQTARKIKKRRLKIRSDEPLTEETFDSSSST